MTAKRERRKAVIREWVENGTVSREASNFRALIFEKACSSPAFEGLERTTFYHEVYACIRELYGARPYTLRRKEAKEQLRGQTPLSVSSNEDAQPLEEVLAEFPLTLHEIDELKPLLERVITFLRPQWERVIDRLRHAEAQVLHLEQQVHDGRKREAELEEKCEQLHDANVKLQARADMFQQAAERRHTAFDPGQHMVQHSDPSR